MDFGAILTGALYRSPCWPNVVDWCVSARLVLGNQQNSVIYKPVPVGANLKIQSKQHFVQNNLPFRHILTLLTVTYDDATKKHDHTLSVDGEIISQLPVTDDELNLRKSPLMPFISNEKSRTDIMQLPVVPSHSVPKSNASLRCAALFRAMIMSTPRLCSTLQIRLMPSGRTRGTRRET